MTSQLIAVRKPTAQDNQPNAEIVFEREDKHGFNQQIFACKSHESWEQWGATAELLSDNVEAVEMWRHGKGYQF